MQHFDSDYMEGAHPLILQRLAEINLDKNPGYSGDVHCAAARRKIREACGCPEAEVHFLAGGTQANAVVIGALLRPYEGVIAASTGHISVHEAGAIEAGGHTVLTLPQKHGKLCAAEVRQLIETFERDGNRAHMVKPGMVYLSHPTEYGALYSAQELREISAVCREYKIPLYLDGARLGYGLAARETDVTLRLIAGLCDVFYIGGTKVGALFGEAVVFSRPELADHFFTIVKQKGALLAKGWLLGVQFDVLFSDGLYLSIAGHAIDMAEKLKAGLREKGCRFYYESPTNQQFIILENSRMEELAREISFSFWEVLDENHTVVRLATSWATREEDVDRLLCLL
jgi:threonine aldolase